MAAVRASGQFDIPAFDRYIQYKAVFVSDNGDRYLELDGVSITHHP